MVQGPQNETTASEANDLESHPGPQCSTCGKTVDVNNIQHVYNMASILHCSENCHANTEVILHRELNEHEAYVSCRDMEAESTHASFGAAPGTVASEPQLRDICVGTLLRVKRNFVGLARMALGTLFNLTIRDPTSNNHEI